MGLTSPQLPSLPTLCSYAERMVQPCPAEENEAYAAWTDGFCAGGSAVLEGACPEDKGEAWNQALQEWVHRRLAASRAGCGPPAAPWLGSTHVYLHAVPVPPPPYRTALPHRLSPASAPSVPLRQAPLSSWQCATTMAQWQGTM